MSETIRQLVDGITAAMAPILAGAFSVILIKLLTVIAAKLRVDVSEKTQNQMLEWTRQGIALAEERAHKARATKITGPEKLEIAYSHVAESIDASKLDKKTKAKSKALAKNLIHSQLPLARKSTALRSI